MKKQPSPDKKIEKVESHENRAAQKMERPKETKE